MGIDDITASYSIMLQAYNPVAATAVPITITRSDLAQPRQMSISRLG